MCIAGAWLIRLPAAFISCDAASLVDRCISQELDLWSGFRKRKAIA
jgi:hypothetical protein